MASQHGVDSRPVPVFQSIMGRQCPRFGESWVVSVSLLAMWDVLADVFSVFRSGRPRRGCYSRDLMFLGGVVYIMLSSPKVREKDENTLSRVGGPTFVFLFEMITMLVHFIVV